MQFISSQMGQNIWFVYGFIQHLGATGEGPFANFQVCCRVTCLLIFVGAVDLILMKYVMAGMTVSLMGIANGHNNPCNHSTTYKSIHNEDHHEDNG
jgi:hypothetical protein